MNLRWSVAAALLLATGAAVAQTEADKVIQTATIARDGAVQTAAIERDRTIEIARITTAVQTAQKSEEESTATAAANEARALAIRAEESVATARATEIANREKNVAVIRAGWNYAVDHGWSAPDVKRSEAPEAVSA